MAYSGYPTPDEQSGDVTYGCIPIFVPNNPEFQELFAAAIYGLYATMGEEYFWREQGTLSPELAAQYAAQGLAATEAYAECGGTVSCDDIADCIETDEGVQLAINQHLSNSGYGTGAGTYDNPSIYTANPLLADGSVITGCDNDNLFGAITQLVDLMDSTLTDAFQQLELLTNYVERTSLLVSGVPAIGLLPIDEFVEFSNQVIDSLMENYVAQYTETIRDDYRCDLFCLVIDTCELDFQVFADYFMSRVGAAVSVENLQAAVEWFITGVWTGDDIVHASHAIICTMLAYGSKFFNVDMAWLSRVVTSSMNDPDADWETLCEDCNPEYPELQIGRCEDAFEAGTLEELSPGHFRISSTFTAGATYAVFERVGGGNISVLNSTLVSGTLTQNQWRTAGCVLEVSFWVAQPTVKTGISFYAARTGNNPFVIEFEVEAL